MENCISFACVYAGKDGCHIKGYLSQEGKLNGNKAYCHIYKTMCINAKCQSCMKEVICGPNTVDSQCIEILGKDLGMSEEEIKNQLAEKERKEEQRRIAIQKPIEPLRRFIAINRFIDGQQKAFVKDSETGEILSADILTKWIEIGINVRKAFEECETDDTARRFKDWLDNVNA